MRPFAFLAVFALLFFSARGASAHAVGMSRGEYRALGSTVHALYVFSGIEIATTFTALDADRDIVQATHVFEDGAVCTPHFESSRATENDAIEIRASFTCARDIGLLTIDCDFLDRFSADHKHLATIELGGRETQHVALVAQKRIEVALGHAPAHASSFGSMVWTGVLHILTGYDHLAFLVGLLLLGGRPRALVGIVTAFTVAHSITLCLAALRVVSVSPSIVEPAIALSIAYVGVENLFVRDASKRWRITFPFGLLHGFGFAGALMELELPRAQLPVALFAFNLGVEVGQLAVLAVVLPIVLRARRNEWFRTRGTQALSVAIAIAGVTWFLLRV